MEYVEIDDDFILPPPPIEQEPHYWAVGSNKGVICYATYDEEKYVMLWETEAEAGKQAVAMNSRGSFKRLSQGVFIPIICTTERFTPYCGPDKFYRGTVLMRANGPLEVMQYGG